VEVEVEIETEVVVEPVAQEVSAPLDEAEPVKESPLEPTPAPEPESPSDTVKSWDAYAQRVMGEKSGLNIEGGKA